MRVLQIEVLVAGIPILFHAMTPETSLNLASHTPLTIPQTLLQNIKKHQLL